MECPTCKGNGRVEMLEHCPDCKGSGDVYDPWETRERIKWRKQQQLERDAERYRYIRDELAYVVEAMADGSAAYGFKAPRKRGATLGEAIDSLRRESEGGE